MYLPKVIAFNAKDATAKKRYGVIADYMGIADKSASDDKKVAALITHLRKMNDDLNIPHCIKNYGTDSFPCENGFVPEKVFLERLPDIAKNAIADAFNYIRLGKANVIVSGGAEAAVAIVGVGGFNAMNALSTRNDSPQTASRPFSGSRDGFVLGEGAAGLVLEEMEHAVARGAKIYAEVVGSGLSADAYHLTASHPEGLGAILVMQNALEDADLTPDAIDYINVHGTSTPIGDISEVRAIKQVFGNHAYELNISSTKSMTGHLLGAAGAVEALASVLAVKNDIVPPTINHAEGDDDPEIDYKLNFTFNKAQKRTVRAALSNTFGFGGHNASVIVKKFEK